MKKIEKSPFDPFVKWFFPKLKIGNILVVPLTDDACPPCALFVKELGKVTDVIDIGALFE